VLFISTIEEAEKQNAAKNNDNQNDDYVSKVAGANRGRTEGSNSRTER